MGIAYLAVDGRIVGSAVMLSCIGGPAMIL